VALSLCRWASSPITNATSLARFPLGWVGDQCRQSIQPSVICFGQGAPPVRQLDELHVQVAHGGQTSTEPAQLPAKRIGRWRQRTLEDFNAARMRRVANGPVTRQSHAV
jgi:hypothetical protein